jgi:hypothetical protein
MNELPPSLRRRSNRRISESIRGRKVVGVGAELEPAKYHGYRDD